MTPVLEGDIFPIIAKIAANIKYLDDKRIGMTGTTPFRNGNTKPKAEFIKEKKKPNF